MKPIAFRSLAPDPHLGTTGLPGEFVVFDGDARGELRIMRILPANPGLVLDAVERGTLEPITPHPALASLLSPRSAPRPRSFGELAHRCEGSQIRRDP